MGKTLTKEERKKSKYLERDEARKHKQKTYEEDEKEYLGGASRPDKRKDAKHFGQVL